jgi:hypothetical protein
VHERDSHVHALLIALHGLLPIPRALYFRIEELTCGNIYDCDFDKYDPHALVLCGYVIIFTRCPG